MISAFGVVHEIEKALGQPVKAGLKGFGGARGKLVKAKGKGFITGKKS